eukprot:m.192416 g.192416  ORF g.192416 m.192416 type:complete len:548 (-) comp14854_c1_seq1:4308-5951(-)
MGCCHRKTLSILAGVIGGLLLALGLASKPMFGAIMRSVIIKDMQLTSNQSQFYPVWKDTNEVPIYMTFYVFNVTNPKEATQGAKPNVSIVGPFNYNEVRIKHEVQWFDDENQVRFHYNRTFFPVTTKCPPGVLYPDFECSLDDSMQLTTGNIALMALANTLQAFPFSNNTVKGELLELIQEFLVGYFEEKYGNEGTFITHPAREIIFGYNDTIMTDGVNAIIKAINKRFDINLPLQQQLVQVQKNNSAETRNEYSTQFTGKNDSTLLLQFTEWAGHNGSLTTWMGTGCSAYSSSQEAIDKAIAEANMINGTDGLTFQPELTEEINPYVWSDDLMRSAILVKSDEIQFENITLWRYTVDPSLMANVTADWRNCAFDAYAPKGTLNLTAVVGGPAFASKEHFLDADPVFLQMVDGVPPPNRTLHDTTLDVEPLTGTSMIVHDRLQINVHLHQVEEIKAFENISEVYLPIVKVDEHATITPKLIKQWKSQVGVALDAQEFVQWIGIGVGSALLLACFVLVVTLIICKPQEIEPATVMDESTLLIQDPQAF